MFGFHNHKLERNKFSLKLLQVIKVPYLKVFSPIDPYIYFLVQMMFHLYRKKTQGIWKEKERKCLYEILYHSRKLRY